MATTLSKQSHLWPDSGTTGWEDGDGFSTRSVRDAVDMLNNLWQFANSRPGFTAGSNGNFGPVAGYADCVLPYVAGGTPPVECFVAQKEIAIAPAAKRMWFGAGIYIRVDGGAYNRNTGASLYGSLTEFKVYISKTPYRDVADPFNAANLAPGYKSITLSLAGLGLDFVTAGDKYAFLKSGDLEAPAPDGIVSRGADRRAFVICTLTGLETINDPESSVVGRIVDWTQWFMFQ